jgi:hypothetical protein
MSEQIEKEYKKAVEFINGNRKNFIILSCEHDNNHNLLSCLVAISAKLRGRKDIYHTSMIVNDGDKILSLEITPKQIALVPFKKAYFSGHFKGILYGQVIKGNKTNEDNAKIVKHIKNNVLNKKYGKLKAFRSWTWWRFWDQQDDDKTIYCTDKILDIVENFSDHNIHGNNAEITPAGLYHKLLNDYIIGNRWCIYIQQLNKCSV